MSYTPRDQSPGYHHIVTRGNNKRVIYLGDADRWLFCKTVTRIAAKHDWRIVAYALMRNHYHLVIHVGDKGLSDGMCELNTGYALWFNKEHGRVNHLFGKRFFSRKLTSESALMTAVRYVVQNPRRAGGQRPLEGYAWTSYAATIGLAYAAMRLARDEVLEFFGETPERGVEAFRAFCDVYPEPPAQRQPP